MQWSVISLFPNCRGSHNFMEEIHQKIFSQWTLTHKKLFFLSSQKNKQWVPPFTEHFFSVLCGRRCRRNNGPCLLQGFVRQTCTDLQRRCSVARCSWPRNLPLLLRCRCRRPWRECPRRSGSDLVFSARSNARCEGRLEKQRHGECQIVFSPTEDAKIPIYKHEPQQDTKIAVASRESLLLNW